jgi:hypothetical protein
MLHFFRRSLLKNMEGYTRSFKKEIKKGFKALFAGIKLTDDRTVITIRYDHVRRAGKNHVAGYMKTRPYILLIFVVLARMLSATACFAQHSVSGTVTGAGGETLCGVAIYESGTAIYTIADTCCRFQIKTQRSGCSLNFGLVGYRLQTVEITRDTVIHVVLEEDCIGCGNSRAMVSVGVTYDAVHAAPGLSLGNGYDEHQLFHFEDFPTRVIYKASAAADFRRGWSFAANAGYRYPARWLSLVETWYRQYNCPSNDFAFRDIHAAASRWLVGRMLAKLKAGHQTLNGAHNWGATAGLEYMFRHSGALRCMAGASAGYYTDY